MTAPTGDPGATTSAFHTHEVSGWRRLLFWPLGLAIKLWGLTWRIEATPASVAAISKDDGPIAIVLWHNRLLITAEVFRRYRNHRPIYGLVSASKDGAWLAAFFRAVGIRSVRGSSSRGGREAAMALSAVLKAGHDIGITPDGPRGPRYDFKPGGLIVARRAGVPVVLLGGEFESAWRLRSWDGFCVPRPFSRVRMRCEVVEAAELAGDRDQVVERLSVALRRLNPDGTADSLSRTGEGAA